LLYGRNADRRAHGTDVLFGVRDEGHVSTVRRE
jgi:hypothetical protein